MNPKEMFMSALRNDKPIKWMGYGFEAFPKSQFHVVIDPISIWDILYLSGESVKDHWGVVHRYLPGDPASSRWSPMKTQVIKDITKWRDYVEFPEFPELDWSDAKKTIAALDRETTMVMVPTFRGLFERAHCLMTFEDVLIYMYEEPEAMYDLFGAITDWKLKACELIIDNMQPDIIHSHDDWGSLTSLFFSPQKFRDLLKPHYARLYSYIKSRGVLVQHHADSYLTGLENDMVDIGCDMWQGVLSTNDIVQIQKNTGGKMLLMGGIDQTLIDHDKSEVTEDVIRAEVRRAIDTYAPGGAYLPCIASSSASTHG
jgi:hypothetical protein